MNNVITFKASRKKAGLLFLGSIGFVALGVWMSAEKPLLGWAIAAFFVLGVPASLLMLLPNALYLRLDEEGFTMGSWFSSQRTKWTDVADFRIDAIRGARMIAIRYRPGYARQQLGRAVAAQLTGMEGAIANSYDAPLEKILSALRTWRERFAGNKP